MIIAYFLVLFSISNLNVHLSAQTNCPSLSSNLNFNSWSYSSPALQCRSECKMDQDCIALKDLCGRVAIVNKNHASEVESYLKQITSCDINVETESGVSTVCKEKRCHLQVKSCSQEKEKRESFLKRNYTDDCEKDSDCSYLSVPNESCMYEMPVSIKADVEKNKLTLQYLNYRVQLGCNKMSNKVCENAQLNQCFIGKCLRVSKRIDFVNYVNFEGVSGKINLKSRTKPLVAAKVTEISCQQSTDCQVLEGVCRQNLISVNKKFYESLKTRVVDFEKKVACPEIKPLKIVKSDCVQGFCVFTKEHD